MENTAEQVKTRTVTVTEAARTYGISRGQAYELARRGELPGVVRLGRRYVVSRAVMERVLNGEPATG
jgi:excisionase family DNA binding protein